MCKTKIKNIFANEEPKMLENGKTNARTKFLVQMTKTKNA